ncbi:hypothetical protein DFP72DRAFT_854164 [Ephemerocybe angulata]|uniref:Uncharacterized protein n=1 Tax=Ephemerocybe angulata TaxID=980116 RepID=A0A8H6HIQ3_9AGAR|nr:hypothetical protein DFP72DRAFT_854164 [Tulosesus angulatus]
MENVYPLGIQTCDSIVVIPSQTLSDADYNMLHATPDGGERHPSPWYVHSPLPSYTPTGAPRYVPQPIDIPMARVKMSMSAKHEYEYVTNYKVLQNVFKSKRVDNGGLFGPIDGTRMEECCWVEFRGSSKAFPFVLPPTIRFRQPDRVQWKFR